jgi:hypothetical protein
LLITPRARSRRRTLARDRPQDVRRDDTLTGPNVELRGVCAATDRPVIASGGVGSLDDLRALTALAEIRVEGAIVGKALYAGAFTLPEALALVRDEASSFSPHPGANWCGSHVGRVGLGPARGRRATEPRSAGVLTGLIGPVIQSLSSDTELVAEPNAEP